MDRRNTRARISDKMRREIDINVAHRHHMTGFLEAAFYLDIGKRSVPRQIDLTQMPQPRRRSPSTAPSGVRCRAEENAIVVLGIH